MPFRAFYADFKEELGKIAAELGGKIRDSDSDLIYPSFSGKFKGKIVEIELSWEVGATFLKIHIISKFPFSKLPLIPDAIIKIRKNPMIQSAILFLVFTL